MPIGLRGTSVGSLNILCHFGHRIAYILVLANQDKFRVLSQLYLAQVKQYFKAQTIPLAACTKIHSGGWWWSCKSFLTVAQKYALNWCKSSLLCFLFLLPRLVRAQHGVAVLAVVLCVIQGRTAERNQAEGPAPAKRSRALISWI